MNILVTGSKGMLGSEIVELSQQLEYQEIDDSSFENKINYIFKDLDLDITNYYDLKHFFTSFIKDKDQDDKIDVVINCAAYTAVDDAEDEMDKAFLINEKGAENLASLSNEFNYLLVQISTDFIFDGENNSIPYTEKDSCNPLSIYGKSKLFGENSIIDKAKEFIIFRTSWLYSIYGKNFFKTILKLSSEMKNLSVIDDQIGTPTYAKDFAEFIIYVLKDVLLKKYKTRKSKDDLSIKEIYNYSNDGEISWFQFAREIVSLSSNNCTVNPVSHTEYKTKPMRPLYSVLDKSKIIREFNFPIKTWDLSLNECYTKYIRVNQE